MIAPEATVFEAIKLMADKNIGALLVMSGGQLHGIFTERDYTRNVALQGKSSKETRVREIVTQKILTVKQDDTVEECMRLMTENACAICRWSRAQRSWASCPSAIS